MKKFLSRLIFTVFLLPFSFPFFAQQKAQHQMRVVEVHSDLWGNLKAKDAVGNNVKVSQYGLGINVNVGKEHLGGILEYNYRRVNLSNLNQPDVKKATIHELLMGIRYFPMRPTFMIGNAAFRITAGGEFGFDLEPNWRFLVFSGIAITPIRSISGATVNFVYRPGTFPAEGHILLPTWSIRVGVIIGPSISDD